ncbi:SusC/RagA family TonB-linked outer membrane protein [Pedobacter metabolipauper]|uniref:TonB-linked SusC/RagA family outer membrane protein n=1 Tax=Pedobacter metabolipauper TaxID=425513 RepID=A0A4R6STI1_9SPHI|nr:TonB-dependent receptor [Pedobacter metabolipauper]TDQ08667.1 TonB-linked SusC/RagA family outer membrane protein [Pedobacter metabolipauper]
MSAKITNQKNLLKRIRYYVMPIMLALICGPLFAQSLNVKGKIRSGDNNQPIPGVTVTEKGTQNGVVASNAGLFSIDINANATLVFTMIGYIPKEVVVGNQREINVILQPDNKVLDEVVVIGYGTARRKDLVGAVNTVSAKEAGANTALSPAQLLVGKMPGVQVVNSQIIIRGTGSFTSVDPLYVIDGIQGDGNVFSTISPQDIETITVLKDASSTAIYGVAAANGVVIVTTKKARAGATRVTFNTQAGISKAWRLLDILKARDYVDLLKDIAATTNIAVPAKLNTEDVLVDRADYQKEVFKTAYSTESDLNVSGGGEKVLYNLSMSYITQDALIKSSRNDRLFTRISLDETLGRFHFGQTLNLRYNRGSGQGASLVGGITYAPYQPILDPAVLGGYSIVTNVNDNSNVGNPLQDLGVKSSKSNSLTLYPQVFGEVKLISGLTFRSQLSGTYNTSHSDSYQYPYVASNNLAYGRQVGRSFGSSFTYTFENYFSYNKTFGKHNLSATLGTSYIDAGYNKALTVLGTGLTNDNIKDISVAPTVTTTGNGSGYGTQFGSAQSWYGRLIYTFNDRYILSGSVRRDGSSNFGINNRYGNFPGVGFAWRFTEESFIKSALPFLSDSRLRAGWGRTGNNKFNLGVTDVFTYSGYPNGNLVYSFGTNEAFAGGTTVATISNPDLHWEQTDQTDIGLDLGFLNNQLTVSSGYYIRKSRGLIVNVPVPTSVGIGGINGIQSVVTSNAADAENKGFELQVSYKSNTEHNFSYTISANGALNKNKTLSLGNLSQSPIISGVFNSLNGLTLTQKGSPIGAFYGYRVDHVASTQAEIDALNATARQKTGNTSAVYQAGVKPGDFLFRDLTGDGVVDAIDQQVLGSAIPKFIYGFNMSGNYKSFDINLVISGVTGIQLGNALKFFTENASTGHNATTAILDRWRKSGDVAALPRAGQSVTSSGNLRPSDFFVENGAYLRVRNLTLGYTFSKNALRSISGQVLSGLRVFAASQNLFTITGYKGYDPEVSGSDFIFGRGIDNGQVPQPRTFIAGIQLGF